MLSTKKSQSGATMIEYALIAALISIIAIAALTDIGDAVKTKFEAVVTALTPSS